MSFRRTVMAFCVCLALTLAFTVYRHRNGQPAPRQALPSQQVVGNRIVYAKGKFPSLILGPGEKRSVRSLLIHDQSFAFGDYIWEEAGAGAGPIWIRVDLPRQIMSVFRGQDEIGSSVILYGTDGKETPIGLFSILERAKEHRSNLYDAEMPFMLRLTNDGVAIHASEVLEGSATHGCIGLPAGFAERVFAVTRRGDRVAIL